MMWSSVYYFEVTVHQILPELCPIKNFHKLHFGLTPSSHPIKLKIDSLLDHCVEQCLLFQGYITPNIKSYAP